MVSLAPPHPQTMSSQQATSNMSCTLFSLLAISEGILAMTGRDKLHFHLACSQVKGVRQHQLLSPPATNPTRPSSLGVFLLPSHIGLKRRTKLGLTRPSLRKELAGEPLVQRAYSLPSHVPLTQWQPDISVSVTDTSHETGLGVPDDRPDPRCI